MDKRAFVRKVERIAHEKGYSKCKHVLKMWVINITE